MTTIWRDFWGRNLFLREAGTPPVTLGDHFHQSLSFNFAGLKTALNPLFIQKRSSKQRQHSFFWSKYTHTQKEMNLFLFLNLHSHVKLLQSSFYLLPNYIKTAFYDAIHDLHIANTEDNSWSSVNSPIRSIWNNYLLLCLGNNFSTWFLGYHILLLFCLVIFFQSLLRNLFCSSYLLPHFWKWNFLGLVSWIHFTLYLWSFSL